MDGFSIRPFAERLEPRLLLSADGIVGGLRGALENGLIAAGNKLISPVFSDVAGFDTPIAGVLQTNHDVNGDNHGDDSPNGVVDDKDLHVPDVSDVLSINVDRNLDGSIPSVGPFASLAARFGFIEGLTVSNAQRIETALAATDVQSGIDNIVDVEEIYQVLVVGAISDFLIEYNDLGKTIVDLQSDFTTFLNGLAEPTTNDIFGVPVFGSLIDLDLSSVSNNSDADHFSFSFTVNLTVRDHQYLVDLGQEADHSEILLPEQVFKSDGSGTLVPANNRRFVSLTSQISIPFSLSLDITAPPVDEQDFNFSIPAPVTISVDDANLDPNVGVSLDGLQVNFGFLGTEVPNPDSPTVSEFNLHMDWAITVQDPSSPLSLGFSVPTGPAVGLLTADNPLPADPPPPFSIPMDLEFDLIIGSHMTSTATAVTFPSGPGLTETYADADAIKTQLQTSLNNAGLSLITVGLTGDDRLTLTLPSTNVTPLGFDPEDIGVGIIAPNVSPLIGAAPPASPVKFLLRVGNGIPELVTVTVAGDPAGPDGLIGDGDDPEDADNGQVSLNSLKTSLQSAVDTAFGGPVVSVGDAAGKLVLSAGLQELEITRTLKLDAVDMITFAEWDDADFDEFIVSEQGSSQFQAVLPLNVRQGVDFGEQNNPGIKIDVQPFDFDDSDLTPDSAFIDRLTLPITDLAGISINSAVSALQQFIDFNVVGSGEMLGMIDQVRSWLAQLRNTELLGQAGIPFVQTVLGDLLAFEDLIHDTLITDDQDTDDTDDDVGRLLAKDVDPTTEDDDDAFVASFATAQDFGARLFALGLLTKVMPVIKDDDGENDEDFASYDRVTKQLTYHVSLDHTLAAANVDADFENLGDLDPIAGIFTQSSVHLQTVGHFDAILGIQMGPGTIDDTTLLNQLNGDIGVDVKDGTAFTAALDVQKIFGRLSSDATFDVNVTTGSGSVVARVTVPKVNSTPTPANDPGTDDNTTLDHLVEDIDTALANAVRLSDSASENLTDRLEADILLGRVVIRAKPGVNHFEMTTSTSNTAYTELGLPTTNATGVFLSVPPPGGTPLNVSVSDDVELRFFVNGSGSFSAVTLKNESSGPVAAGEALTGSNVTLTDLVNDINAAIAQVPALNGKIAAGRSGGSIVLASIDSSVQSFRVQGVGAAAGEIGFGSDQVAAVFLVAPNDVNHQNQANVFGQLTTNAHFNVSSPNINSGVAVPVTVFAAATDDNSSVAALIEDINTAIGGTMLGGKIEAFQASDLRIAFRAIDASVLSFNVSATAGDSAVTQMGLQADMPQTADAAPRVGAIKAAPFFYGPAADAHFVVDANIYDFNPAAVVDTSADTFAIAGHGLQTGLALVYDHGPGGSDIGGLASGTTYFVIEIDDNTFQLAATKSDAEAATPVPIHLMSTGGGAAHTFGRPVTVATGETLTNRTIQDLVGDVRRALDAAFGGVTNNPLVVSNDGDRLLFRPKSTGIGLGLTSFSVSASTTDPAVTDLKLYQAGSDISGANVTSASDDADLLIYTASEKVYRVVLPTSSTATIGDVRNAINGLTAKMGDPTPPLNAEINAINAGLNVEDNTTGPALLRIDSVNGSHAAQALGIFGADTDVNHPTPDDRIDGTRIATLQLGDRFFLRHESPGTPIVSAEVVIGAASFDGSSTSVVSSGSNTVQIPQHGFLPGTALVYDHGPGGTDIGGLTTGDTYYVIVVDENTVKLASSPENAAAGTGVGLSTGTGTDHRLQNVLDLDASFGFVGVTLSGFGALVAEVGIGLQDTSATAKVTIAELLKSLSTDQDGDGDADVFDLTTLVTYPTVTPLSGPDFGTFTFEVELQGGLDPGDVQTTAGAQILFTLDDFGNPFAGPKSVEFVAPGAVSLVNDTIAIAGHGLSEGMAVAYRHGPNGSDIGGLLDGKTYYVIEVDPNTIKLATTEANAQAGTAIDLKDSAGTGSHQHLQGFVPVPPHVVVDADAPELGDLLNLDEISFDNVITALEGLADFLNQFSELSFLNEEIPLIGVSFNDLVDIADRFGAAVTEIVQNPAASIQLIEQKVRETFGLPPDGSVFDFELVDDGVADGNDRDMLKISMDIEKAFSESLSVELDLSDQLPGISLMGAAGLNAAGFLNAELAFGVDLDSPSDLYLFTSETSIAAGLSATANNLTFNAALGPAGIFVTGGDVLLNLTGGISGGGDKELLTDVLADLTGTFTPSFGGAVAATLPVFFPTQSTFKGDIEFEATVALTPDFGLDFDTHLDVPPDILNIDFTEFNIFDSLGLAVDTFDAFLAGIQDLLDGEIFGLELPLIGDKLADGAEFINDVRRGTIQPFRELIETSATQGSSLIQTFLFDVLGPGSTDGTIKGIGLLLDPTDADDDHPDGTPVTQTDRDHIDQIVKISENLTGPIASNFAQWDFTLGQVYAPPLDFDFDLGFPGLGLDLDGGLDFELGWTLRLGFGVSIADGPYIVITRTNSDDPLSHSFPNSPVNGFHDSFEDISPNKTDIEGDLGSSAGRVNGLSSVPGSNDVFFAASEYGGIYKTVDAGKTWQYQDGHLPQVTWDVEASSASQVYAASFYDGRVDSIAGINVSTDGGATWVHPASAKPVNDDSGDDNTPQTGYREVSDLIAEPSAFGIAIARDDPSKVAIGTNTGLALSSDSGATWRYVDPTQSAVFFDPVEDVLTFDDTIILDRYISFLQNNPSLDVVVSGHTDTVRTNDVNLGLSDRRADAVITYLTGGGVSPGRITKMAFGETRLAVDTGDGGDDTLPGTDELANRRVELNVLAGHVFDVVYQASGIIDVVGPFGHARSTDDGVTWRLNEMPGTRGGLSIAASPDENNVLFAVGADFIVTPAGRVRQRPHLYESDDGGANWIDFGTDDSPQGRIPFVTVNDGPGTSYDVWFGDTNLFRIPATSGVAGTRLTRPAQGMDGVNNDGDMDSQGNPIIDEADERGWVASKSGAHPDVGDVVFDAAGFPRIHSSDGGVYRNTVDAQLPAWTQPDVGPHGWWMMGFAGVDQPDSADHEDIYIGLQDNGMWALTQAGAADAASKWHNEEGADVFDIAADNDRVLWNLGVFAGATHPIKLFLSSEAVTGSAEINKYPGSTTAPVFGGDDVSFKLSESFETWGDDKFAILMKNGGTALGDGGLFITSNIKAGTIQWTELGNATEPNSQNFADLQVALNAGVPTFYATTDNGLSINAGGGNGNGFTADQLWKFEGTDPNGSWTRIDTNINTLIPGTTGITLFAADRANPDRLYAVALTPLGPQIVRSNNGGMTWQHDLELDGMMTGGGAFKAQNQHGPGLFPFTPTPIGSFDATSRGLRGYPQPTLLAFDPEDSDVIVAGAADAGLFLSTNNGDDWRLLTDPLGTNPDIPHLPRPRFVHFDHEGDILTLYVASQGRGVWRIRADAPVSGPITPDIGEPNDSEPTAEVFDLSEDIDGDHAPELNNRTIHNAADVDVFKYTAEHTGNAIVALYFDKLFGDLDLKVKLPNGTILTNEQFNLKDHLDSERLIFPVVQGENYFVEVSGAGDDTGFYDLVIERSVPELDLFVVAGIETGTTLSGRLAFLQLDATAVDDDFDGITTDGPEEDGKDPTQIRVDFTVDIYNGDNPGDERLSLFELGSLDAAIGVTADAEANLDLELGLNKELLPDTISAAIPTLQASFLFDWSVGGPITDFSLEGGLKLIEFRDIGVDLGSFLSDTVGPIVAKIQEVTDPLQPIIEIVTARIPVLSDLAGRTVTLADIAAAFGEFDPAMIYAVADIVSLVNSFDVTPGTNLFLKLGDFKIFQKDDPGTPVDESANTLLGGGGSGLLLNPNFNFGNDTLESLGIPDFSDKLNGLTGLNLGNLTDPAFLDGLLSGQGDDPNGPTAATTKSLFTGGFSSTPDDSGFDFPIFKDPSQFVGLLLGRDATLITYDLPPFAMDFKWEVSFPIYGPLWGVVSAGVGMKIDVAFGYDTAGVRKFAEGGFSNPLDLIAGFFVSDTNMPDGSFGVDVPELVFSGTIGVGAELNAGVASAGVTANIILTVDFDLYDPNHDGKVRIDELVSTFLFEARNGDPLLAPISIFDVSGNIAFQLSAFLKILFAKFTFNITPPIVLFEFSIPFDREPILATERGDGSVLLNIGPNASARQNGDTRDLAEVIHVKDASGGKVAVWSELFGVPESAAQLYSIGGSNPVVVGFGGEANDVMDVSGLSAFAAVLDGGSGNDVIVGGINADTITGAIGDDKLFGERTAEAIAALWEFGISTGAAVSAGGRDIIRGDEGNDFIDGGFGDDIIFGDSGRVRIAQEPELEKHVNDSIRVSIGAKDGNDTITGGPGRDIVFGGGGEDMIGGDVDPGTEDGGTGSDGDFIFGDGGSLSIASDAGIFPTLGVNVFEFVENADGTRTYGNTVLIIPPPDDPADPTTQFVPFSLTDRPGGGNDVIFGHGGMDVIFAGSGNDTADGGEQDDAIFGQAGLDVISGGGGADHIEGGTEDDRIFGRRAETYAAVLPDGGDTIFGQNGNDFIRGNAGNDHIEGNAGADVIFGDQDQDFILGQTEPDLIFGGPGRDFIDGGTANDVIFGDDGVAVWVDFGGAGDHKVIGLVSGNPDAYDGVYNPFLTDVSLDSLDADIRAADDEQAKTQDLLKTLVNAAGDGNDTAVGGEGDDIVFGGADALFDGVKGDTLYGDFDPAAASGTPGAPVGEIPAGDDILIGDGGRVQFAERRRDNVRTLPGSDTDADMDDYFDEVGNDAISGNGGSDLIFGGGANDMLYGRMPATFTDPALKEDSQIRDDDLIIGDDGEIQYQVVGIPDGAMPQPGPIDPEEAGEEELGEAPQSIVGIRAVFHHIFTNNTDADALATGGSDTAFGNKHDDIIFGGVANDVLKGDDGLDGDDIILGDNGQIDFGLDDDGLTTKVTQIYTTDTTEVTGGPDTIEGQDDNDIIFGGVNNGGPDVIYGDRAITTAASIAADGQDIVLGDNGKIRYDVDADLDTLDLITSYLDGLGGADTISGNKGDDLLIGSTGCDVMYGDDAAASAGADDGEDIMLGDNGDIQLIGTTGRLVVRGTAVDLITTTDIMETTGGADIMSGNAKADIMLGGVNNGGIDSMYGDRLSPNDATIANDGDDVLLGDNGLLDFTYLQADYLVALDFDFADDSDRNTLDLIRSFEDGLGGTDAISGNKGLDVGIGGTGGDTIYGDDAFATAEEDDLTDLLLGDNADIFLVDPEDATGGDLKVVLDTAVMTIRTTDEEHPEYGGSDTVSGNAASDIIAGGVDGDFIYGDAASVVPQLDGDDVILGDNGLFEWLSTGRLSEMAGIDVNANNPDLYAKYASGVADTNLTTLDLITTEQPNRGGRDEIYGDEASDLVFGGTDLDIIHGDDGNGVLAVVDSPNRDILFGDHGRLYPQFPRFQLPNSTEFVPADFPARNFFAIDVGDGDGGEGDQMWGEEGDDVMLGQQGDDRMWGGTEDDDMIGGHNVAGGYDELTGPAVVATLNPAVNDLMDGGSGDDAMSGDNAIIWRRGDDISPRFRELVGDTIYTTSFDGAATITTNVEPDHQSDPADAVARDIELLDHADDTAPGLFGADVMAGGADSDVMFGQLADDLMQGDGNIASADDDLDQFITRVIDVQDAGVNPDTDETLYFNVPELASDADDYMEGNGGNDLMYGGLGQDDMIGGSSNLFGLITEAMRPDGADILFGGAGAPARLARNDFVGLTDTDSGTDVGVGALPTDDDPSISPVDRHSRDADFVMGDNANVFRLVQAVDDQFLVFEYDKSSVFEDRGGERIVVRGMQQLDYTIGGADYNGGEYVNGAADVDGDGIGAPADNGAGDLIHGESGDDYLFGMTGSDVMFGNSDDDDIVGGYGHDWASGGTGQDGVLGDDGLLLTSRNSILGEPLYGIAGLLATDPRPKYSDGTVLNEVISTPGNIQYSVINVEGELKKSVDLVPFSYDASWLAMDDEYPDNDDNTPFADDIIFGGLDDDFLHGASGDDAISGAEALEEAYVPTFDNSGNLTGVLDLGYNAFDLTLPINPGDVVAVPNPGDVLAFNPVDLDGQHLNNRFRAGEFFLYDEYDPLRKIQLDSSGNLWKPGNQDTPREFLLNFDEAEGLWRPGGVTPGNQNQSVEYESINDDGADAAFGDLGNDWLVGGTGRDNMYGGWGNDLLNADDNHDTNSDLNDQPDTHPDYEDRTYGGAGRDVSIGNTGGDRLIDWVGEYNSYLVPFAPFGMATVSRTLQPFLPEFLYALSAGDGADPTRYGDANGGTAPPEPTKNKPNPGRNGEPGGELGLVLQKDFAWQAQTGAPADPQAGNIPGGKRDVLRSASFDGLQGNQNADGFFVDSGSWTVTGGRYQVEPESLGGDALSVFKVDKYVPKYFEVLATLNPLKPIAGYKANSFVVFDYQSDTDFKFAGINVSTNKLEIGHRTETGWQVDVQSSVQGSLKSDTDYNVFLSVNGSAVILIVDNQFMLSYAFQPRIDDDGFVHFANEGMVGLGADNAKAQIDNMVVQRLAPAITFTATVDFNDGTTTDLMQPPTSGTWEVVNERYEGTPGGDGSAISLTSLSVSPASLIDISATLSTTGEGGIVFDQYDAENFKFVSISAGTITIGHRTNKGWFVDATYNAPIVTDSDVTLGVTLRGTTVSVTLDDQPVFNHVFNALVTDGEFGVFSRAGTTSFDTLTVQTDDPDLSDD